MTPFTQYKQWMIHRYGEAMFRIPVEISSTCPHGRCAFCSDNGSRAQQTQHQNDPFEQAEEAIRFSKRRYRAKKFMLYIQAFTTDLTNPAQQKTILDLLERFEFSAISIGTRPDCLPEEALEFLESLSRVSMITPLEVWVELGIQTAKDETLETIHRGHDWACSKQAILNLAAHHILVAPHVIIGLPGETAADWKRTAEELAALPLDGIKIHNLHVVKGTALANDPPPMLNHWEYAEALMDFLRRIPANIPVMRISTDTPDDQLIAPHWHLEKGQFLDYVMQQMTMRELRQGDLFEAGRDPLVRSESPVVTDDGSITFFSEDWKEHYHTKTGARLEADKKFIEPSGLAGKLQTSALNVLDVCFGLGNNSLAAICAAEGAPYKLNITALEMDKRIVRTASKHFQLLKTDPINWQGFLKGLLLYSTVHIPEASTTIRWGDARWLIQAVEDDSVDLIFHDAFSSQHCPELWTVDFFMQLCRVLKPEGLLLTYSSSQPVRGAMREAGLCVAETIPGHRMGNGTVASPSPDTLTGFQPVDELDVRRSIPYRDEFLCATSKAILRQRQEIIERTT